ncbi:hypothetical protein BAY1663_03148 [Pseudomonas sp. BAY1663]|nr:hypothetical protein BAY1663_03148 [Pseudomonas sp. BAY1663]
MRLSGSQALCSKRAASAGARQDHHRRLGQQSLAGHGLPVVAVAAQFEGFMVLQQFDARPLQQPATERRRMCPAGFGIEQAALGQGDARQGFGLLPRQWMHQGGREGIGQFGLALPLLVVVGDLQHAAGLPVAALLQMLEQAPGMAETADDQPRQRRAVGRELEIEHALRVARTLLGRFGLAFEQGDLPAPCGQGGRRGTAGEAGTDHQRAACRGHEGRAGVPGLDLVAGLANEAAAEDFPLVAEARYPLHVEAGLGQPAAHEAGAGEGAQGCARRREPRQFGEQRRLPHVRVLRRGEAVEEPGIDGRIEARQGVQHVADQQRQHHPAVGEKQALKARVQRDVLLQQLFGQGLQFRPERQCPREILAGQGVLLDADEMQLRPRIGNALEQLPGAEEVQAGAEAGFADHQPLPRLQRGEALRQRVLGEEHVLGFRQARGAGEVHVAVAARLR